MRSCSLLLAVALLAAPSSGPCQDAPASAKNTNATPESVAEGALQALQKDRIEDFVAAMHPDALKQFRTMLLEIVAGAEADNQAEQVLALFSDVDSTDALRTLDDRGFFLAFYRGIMRLQPDLKAAMAGSEQKILGHVMEGEDTAHVVCRLTIRMLGVTVSKMNVISMKRLPDGGWAMLLSGEMDGITTMLRQRFGKNDD